MSAECDALQGIVIGILKEHVVVLVFIRQVAHIIVHGCLVPVPGIARILYLEAVYSLVIAVFAASFGITAPLHSE